MHLVGGGGREEERALFTIFGEQEWFSTIERYFDVLGNKFSTDLGDRTLVIVYLLIYRMLPLKKW